MMFLLDVVIFSIFHLYYALYVYCLCAFKQYMVFTCHLTLFDEVSGALSLLKDPVLAL